MGVLIEGGTVLTPRGPIDDGALAINGDQIVAVGRADDLRRSFDRYDRLRATGCLVMPGLINSHTHCAMTLFRGYAEDMPLMDWLEKKVWPAEVKLTPSDIELGAELGAYEALLSGTTTLNSQYFYSDDGSEVHAFIKTGIRAVVGHGFFESTKEEGLRLTERMAERWHGAQGGRIRISVNPHAPYSTGPDAYVDAHRLTNELNEKLGERGKVIMHTHVAEAHDEARRVEEIFGVSAHGGSVAYLDSLGVLSGHVVAAHAIHVSDEEVSTLRKRNVAVALNPVSNLKLAMGVAPYSKLRASGIRMGLGTDGPASNNSLDMFESTKVLALVQKGWLGDPTALPAREVFDLATSDGASAIGWGDQIGALAIGYKADVVVLDLRNIQSLPLYDPYSHLIYSTKSTSVRDVFVDGKQLVENGMIVGLDYESFFNKVERTKNSLLSRVGQ